MAEALLAPPLVRSSLSASPAMAVDDAEQLALFTQWETSSDGVACGVGVSHLQLSGLHCAACAGDIERALMAQPGVLGAEVNGASQRAKVRWDASRTRASALIASVEAAGYGAAPDVARSARELRTRERRDILWRFFVASFLSMQVMMLATPSYVAADGDIAPDLERLLAWGQWVLSVPVLIFGAGPFLSGAWRSFKRRRIGMDVPVSLGLVATFVVSSVVAFDPAGPFGHELYFDSMTMFVAFLWFGRWLEMRARHQAAESLESSLRALPDNAWRVLDDGSVHEVPAARLQPGQRVRVLAGATVPADGLLISEGAAIEEALLTGESLAVSKARGDALLAGSVNVLSPFEMEVRQVGAATRQAVIAALMREALACRPELVRLADRWAGPFLWAVLALAVGGGVVWSLVDPARAVWVAVSVLIVTCPCALSLATPATWVAAAAGLARRGILLRRLDALQAAAHLQRLFVDKTGTLTQTTPQLAGIHVPACGPAAQGAGQASNAQCISRVVDAGVDRAVSDSVAVSVALQLAQWSAHPLTKALREQLPSRLADMPGLVVGEGLALSQVQEVPGRGLQAVDADGRTWRMGSAVWAAPGAVDAEGALAPSRLSLSCDGQALMSFSFTETLRADAPAAVRGLKARGIELTLLSGDTAERAQRVAQALGIQDVRASATPESKLEQLRQVQAQGAVCGMLGDGLNDSAVLGAADLAIAMGEGAALAQQHADVVLLRGEPAGVVDLVDSARRTMAIVRQNLAWSAAYNAVCIPAALMGWLPPWAAGLGMAASSVAVVLNAQRAGR
ncbi:MAG: heavy metal translocating P-type ATPase [Rubrivivax sp.]